VFRNGSQTIDQRTKFEAGFRMGFSFVKALKLVVPAPVRRWLRRVQYLGWLPTTRWGDYVSAFYAFRMTHGRWPRKDSWLFADVLFRLRSRELALPERVRISDKENVKEFIRERVGDRYNIPTLAVLRSVEDAVRFAYPATCVIKPTHLTGEAIFAVPGVAIDRARIARWFGRNLYDETREANYRPLVPKVIVEPYVLGRIYPDVASDYRVSCVEGRPRMIRVVANRFIGTPFCAGYDLDWNYKPVAVLYPLGGEVPRPDNLEEMLDVAARLSAGFSWLRVDLYSNGRDLAVGELTNCTGGGLLRIEGELIASQLQWPERFGR
jgi:hypothetical protein